MSNVSLLERPPAVTPANLHDVLAGIVYSLEAAHFHLNAGGVPAGTSAFRNARSADERMARAAKLAMELLAESGYDRAPMCQPWPEAMPDDWRGPTCWAENDAPKVEHEPEPCEYDLGDVDGFERTFSGEDLSHPDAFDAWLAEEQVRG